MWTRRTFVVALGTIAFEVHSSSAQQHSRKPQQIGWLVPTTQAEWDGLLEEYRIGMRKLGYIEGRTVETEYLYADGHSDRLPDLAAKLVEQKVDVIVTSSTPAILAAKRATDKIRSHDGCVHSRRLVQDGRSRVHRRWRELANYRAVEGCH